MDQRSPVKFVPLNDYIATVIGLVRDNADFRTVLYEDVLYIGNSGLGLPAYSQSNNNHYEALEDGGFSLKDNLIRVNQSTYSGLPTSATAGVMTSRAAARAFQCRHQSGHVPVHTDESHVQRS